MRVKIGMPVHVWSRRPMSPDTQPFPGWVCHIHGEKRVNVGYFEGAAKAGRGLNLVLVDLTDKPPEDWNQPYATVPGYAHDFSPPKAEGEAENTESAQ